MCYSTGSLTVAMRCRVKEHPLVSGAPKLRFLAAAPIMLPGGQRLGAL